MRKIMIFYASFGMGHKSAAMAIRETLQKKYGIDAGALDFFARFMPGFNNVVRLLYDTSISKMPKAYGTFFRITDDMSRHPVAKELDKVGFSSFERFIAHESPDHIIATFPISGRIEKLKKKYGFTYSVVITDFGVHGSWIRDYVDVYFAADDKVRNDLLRRKIPDSSIVVSGIPVRQQFSQSFDRPGARRKFGLTNKFTVLLIGRSKDVTKTVIPLLCELHAQIVVVAGKDKRFLTKLLRMKPEYNNLVPLGFIEDVARLMQASDLMIGKGGGLTLSEALASGVPMVIFEPIPGQEFFNVDFLVSEGAALYARDSDDLIEKVRFLLERQDRLLEMKKNTVRLGKPHSTEIICERIMKMD